MSEQIGTLCEAIRSILKGPLGVAGQGSKESGDQAASAADETNGPSGAELTSSQNNDASWSISAIVPLPSIDGQQTYQPAFTASVPDEDIDYTLPEPAVAEQTTARPASAKHSKQDDKYSAEGEAVLETIKRATAAENYSLPEPKTAWPTVIKSENDITATEEAGSIEDEDASHSMLLQALTELQAENAGLENALSAQSLELQSLRCSTLLTTLHTRKLLSDLQNWQCLKLPLVWSSMRVQYTLLYWGRYKY